MSHCSLSHHCFLSTDLSAVDVSTLTQWTHRRMLLRTKLHFPTGEEDGFLSSYFTYWRLSLVRNVQALGNAMCLFWGNDRGSDIIPEPKNQKTFPTIHELLHLGTGCSFSPGPHLHHLEETEFHWFFSHVPICCDLNVGTSPFSCTKTCSWWVSSKKCCIQEVIKSWGWSPHSLVVFL